MALEIQNPEKGIWYDSTEFYPKSELKVLCCLPGLDLFWLDFVHNFGPSTEYDLEKLRDYSFTNRNEFNLHKPRLCWFKERVSVDKTDHDRNPFAWQVPILKEVD